MMKTYTNIQIFITDITEVQDPDGLLKEKEDSLDQNVMESLSYFGIKWPDLVVPKPEELKAELDRVMSEILDEDGDEEESKPRFRYDWLLARHLCSEPFLGGQQIGELPEIDITNSDPS
jgi:hypothetical protein